MAKHSEDKMATGLPMSLAYEGNFSSNTPASQPEWLRKTKARAKLAVMSTMFVTRYLSYHVPVTAVGQLAYLQQGKGEDKAGHNVASVCYVDDGCCRVLQGSPDKAMHPSNKRSRIFFWWSKDFYFKNFRPMIPSCSSLIYSISRLLYIESNLQKSYISTVSAQVQYNVRCSL
jgi:hypothetical protein